MSINPLKLCFKYFAYMLHFTGEHLDISSDFSLCAGVDSDSTDISSPNMVVNADDTLYK